MSGTARIKADSMARNPQPVDYDLRWTCSPQALGALNSRISVEAIVVAPISCRGAASDV